MVIPPTPHPPKFTPAFTKARPNIHLYSRHSFFQYKCCCSYAVLLDTCTFVCLITTSPSWVYECVNGLVMFEKDTACVGLKAVKRWEA